ncbi:MAG: TetR/AcrR family transcriptional regulator [Actinomycetota bacterium]|nr:TetR/AcrR family transcriptional regulator [Actinomycetota bacterium]
MVEAVKRSRPYDSPRRREQAAATRRLILEAAQRLFEREGYAATSVPAIAAEAGVALKTVYVVFETKAKLLRELWDERLSEDETGIPVVERAWYQELLEESDPERKLSLLARQSRVVKTRSGTLMEVIRNAGSADPEIAGLWNDIQTKLLDVQRSIIEQLEGKDALVGGLDVVTATDILWTLNHPSVWHLLVGERGWTAEGYERWLGETFCLQLLGGGSLRSHANGASRSGGETDS